MRGPTLLVPPHHDSTATAPESAPAPLLIPGRVNSPDTTHLTRAQRARQEFQLAEALERDRQPGAAIAAYDVALKLDPTLTEANYRMGLLYLTRDQVAPAVHRFIAELRRQPNHVGAQRELGLGLARLGDTTRAIARLEALTRRVPKDDRNWQALAFAYTSAHRLGQAEAALRRAIELSPARAGEHRDLAVLLEQRGRVDAAREEYRKALAIDPADASVWYNLGNLERRAGRAGEALEAFQQSAAHDSSFALALKGQIVVLDQLGRSSEAGEVYWRWLGRNPLDHDVRLDAMRYFARLDQPDLALQLGQDAVRLEPKSGDARMILAIGLDLSGRTRAALTELRTAEKLLKDRESLDQVRQLIAGLRARAPDSLRTVFEADSLAHAQTPP